MLRCRSTAVTTVALCITVIYSRQLAVDLLFNCCLVFVISWQNKIITRIFHFRVITVPILFALAIWKPWFIWGLFYLSRLFVTGLNYL